MENGTTDTEVLLIADFVTYLVVVAGKEPSDLLVEQGLLVGTTEFFAKSHVLKWV